MHLADVNSFGGLGVKFSLTFATTNKRSLSTANNNYTNQVTFPRLHTEEFPDLTNATLRLVNIETENLWLSYDI